MPDRLFQKTVLGGAAVLFFASAAWCQPRPAQKVESFTQQDIDKVVRARTDFLLSAQLPDGSWPPYPGRKEHQLPDWTTAPTSMAVYALIETGISAKDPRLAKALDWLAKNQDQDVMVYSMGFRCNAWLAANKQTKKQYMKNLQKDVDLLAANGIFYKGSTPNYICDSKATLAANKRGPVPSGAWGDNSNSQYVLLGVWAGHRGGMEIPKEYWKACLDNWLARQNSDGGWCYGASGASPSYGSMTTAGLASLFICIDTTMGDKFIKCSIATEFAPVKKGLDWFDANFEKILTAPWTYKDAAGDAFQYFMYGVERVGLASGYKYFGKYDWYKEGSRRLLAIPSPEKGADVDSVVESAYILLFFARGGRPVLFNRLEYDGDWNNRPRALANFCRWAEGVYENEVNWQIITLKSPVDEWHDAPVVAISGSKAPKFSEDDIVKLRTFVNQGGTIFSMTECGGGTAFGKGLKDAYRKIFPKYELTLAGKEHPIFTCQYKLPGSPAFHIISNGIRPLAIHTDVDLPVSWQTYAVATGRQNFEAAANVLMYVTDKQIKSRGSKVWPEEPAKAAGKTLKAARIRYAGNYDPEPLAIQRLSRLLWKNHDVRLDCQSALPSASSPADSPSSGPAKSPASAPGSSVPATGISLSELTADIKVAFMTGTGAFSLPQAEKDALKKWVDSGGLLVLDAGGAAKGFADSARELIGELWGADSLLALPLSSPVYQMKDMTIEKVKYRRAARARLGGMREPHLQAVLAGDRPKVIFSHEDLTGGLVGYSTFGMDGYEPQSAFDVMRNVIFYAAAAPPVPRENAIPTTKPPE
ncbi:MAG: DUF4159 domain-containing protein [Planctomycetes bacterium]|nr:DUF4159 domain-containing protein [Planctomycetota bacterium]